MHAKIDVHSRRLIAEFRKDGIKCIETLQSHYANINFSDKSRYDRIFQLVTHKGGGSAMNCIKISQNEDNSSFSAGNYYSEDQMMRTFLSNFHQGGIYSVQITIHQAELRREEKITDNFLIFISYSQTDYLNLGSISGFGRTIEKADTVQTNCKFCGGTNHYAEMFFKSIGQEKEKLVRLVILTTDKRNGHLRNILNVDLKIT